MTKRSEATSIRNNILDTDADAHAAAAKIQRETSSMTPTQKREIAFIDRGVDDLATLLAGIRPDVEPILLNNHEPAPRQMARALMGREGLEAIHVIAHGRPGEVSFSAGALNVETMGQHCLDFANIGRALRDEPHDSQFRLGQAVPSLGGTGRGRRDAVPGEQRRDARDVGRGAAA